MNDHTRDFVNKIKVNTYIYTFTFISVSVLYTIKYSMGSAPMMLLLAAFAFYALGRQINLINDLEKGDQVDTAPKAPVWVRGVTFFIVMLLALSMVFV